MPLMVVLHSVAMIPNRSQSSSTAGFYGAETGLVPLARKKRHLQQGAKYGAA